MVFSALCSRLRASGLLTVSASCALFLGGCAGTGRLGPSVVEGMHPNGKPHYHLDLDSAGRKHGMERWWYESGTPKSEASWWTGRRHGVYRAWYPDGKPWYAGRDSLGVPVDTLRYWHANGVVKSVSAFAGGKPVSLETFDEEGLTPAQRARRDEEIRARDAARRRADSLEAAEGPRRRALAAWSGRARAAVETYWSLPESQKKTPRRAVAVLRVAPDGRILAVSWPVKSGSPEFDRRAARALARAKRLPPLPPELGPAPLELRYEFTTPGVQKRRKLQLRDPGAAVEGD